MWSGLRSRAIWKALQDRMAPFPQAEAEAAVAAALGKPLREAFTRRSARRSRPPRSRRCIAPEADGQTVAVKVLRPGIERRFKSDLDTLYFAARTAERHSAEARRLRMIEVVDTLARSVTIEMDLRLEAAAIAEMRDNVKDDPDFRVPTVDWERTARGVLTLEWIDGTPLSDRAALEARGLDLPALGRALMQTFLRHALRDGFFHADMHPGNLFVDARRPHRRRSTSASWGGSTPKERRFLAEILYGFITRDYHRTAEVHFEAGYVPPHHSVESFAQAIRAIGEPIHNRPASEISMAKLLTLLFEVTGLFDMKTRPELLMLQKTMVVVEGVARSFDRKPRHVGDRRAGGARMDRAPSRPRRPARRRRAGRRRGRTLPRRRAGAARPRRDASPTRSTPRRATAWCSRPKPSRRSGRPRRGAAAGPRSRCG